MKRTAFAAALVLLTACNHDDGADAGDGGARDAGDAGTDLGTADAGDAGGADGGAGSCPTTTWNGTMPSDGICSPSGWCLVSANLPGRWSYTVDNVGTDDSWAAASEGPILHWNGTTWSGTTAGPIGGTIQVSPSGDVWVIGGGSGWDVRHWDGTTFTTFALPDTSASSPTLRSFWAASATDVWMVGDVARAEHWDGTSWTPTDVGAGTASLTLVQGSAGNDVWVASSGAPLRHFDGTSWTDRAFATGYHSLVATPSGGGAWVGGYASLGGTEDLRRWNGTSWTSMPFSHVGDSIVYGEADPAANLYFMGTYRGISDAWYWDGATLSAASAPEDYCTPTAGAQHLTRSIAYDRRWMLAFGGCSSDPLWGRIDRLEGTPLSPTGYTPFHAVVDAHDITPLTSDDDVLYGDATGIERGIVGGAHVRQTALEGHGWPLHGDIDTGDVWTISATTGAVDHYDGTSWSTSFVHGGTVHDVAVTSGHVFAIVGTTVYRYTGSTWADEGLPAADRLDESGGDTVYALASMGGPLGMVRFSFFDGTGWTSADQGFSVTCAGPTGTSGELDVLGPFSEFPHLAGLSITTRAGDGGTGCAIRNGRAIVVSDTVTTPGREMSYFDGTTWCDVPWVPGESTLNDYIVAIGPGGRAWRETFPGRVDPMLIEYRPR